MLLSIGDLPENLGRLVEKFTVDNAHLSISYQASGRCVVATQEFYRFMEVNEYPSMCLDLGIEIGSWWWKDSRPYDIYREPLKENIGPVTPHNYYFNNGYPGHCCAWVAEEERSKVGFFIDFTARQYDTAAPFPLIWRGGYELV